MQARLKPAATKITLRAQLGIRTISLAGLGQVVADEGAAGTAKNLMAFEFVVLDELAEGIFLRFAQPFALRQGTGPVQNASRIQKRRQDFLVQAVSGIAVHLESWSD